MCDPFRIWKNKISKLKTKIAVRLPTARPINKPATLPATKRHLAPSNKTLVRPKRYIITLNKIARLKINQTFRIYKV